MANLITVGLIQMSCRPEVDQNLSRAVERLEQAASSGAQIACLPELFRSLYPCQTEDSNRFDLAEPIPGPTTNTLSQVARRLSLVIIVPIFEKRAPGVFHNSAVVLDADGRSAGLYRKMHIPDDPYFYEKFYFTPGDRGFLSHSTQCGRIGVLICWDQWFPEAARLTVLSGASLLCYPTAIGWLEEEEEEVRPRQLDAWITVQRAHAVTNGIFVAAVNRVGSEGSLTFWGNSFVCDPQGQVLARASGTDEEVLIVDCDLDQIETMRRQWPFLRDRRVDAYGELGSIFRDNPHNPNSTT